MLERAQARTRPARWRRPSSSASRLSGYGPRVREHRPGDPFVSEGKSPEEFQRALLAHAQQRSKAVTDHGGGEGEALRQLGMTDKDLQRYSMMNVVRALANPHDKRAQDAAFEMEPPRRRKATASRLAAS